MKLLLLVLVFISLPVQASLGSFTSKISKLCRVQTSAFKYSPFKDENAKAEISKFKHYKNITSPSGVASGKVGDQAVRDLIYNELVKAEQANYESINEFKLEVEKVYRAYRLFELSVAIGKNEASANEVKSWVRKMIFNPEFDAFTKKLYELNTYTITLEDQIIKHYSTLSKFKDSDVAKLLHLAIQSSEQKIAQRAINEVLLSTKPELTQSTKLVLEKVNLNNIQAVFHLQQNFNKRSIEVLERLSEMSWWQEKVEHERLVIFFHLNYLALKIESSVNAEHGLLLTNTLDYLLNNEVPIHIKALEDGHRGSAFPDGSIELTSKNVSWSGGILNSFAKKISIEVLAHEVNHLISNDFVSSEFQKKSIKNFIEEYRAWQVGFYAYEGRLPNIQEGINQIQSLISDNGTYPIITKIWQESRFYFKPYFLEMGISVPTSVLSESYQHKGELYDQLRDYMDSGNELLQSPLWGWNNFQFNEAK